MQPQNPSKPVMDVSPPRPAQPGSMPAAPASTLIAVEPIPANAPEKPADTPPKPVANKTPAMQKTALEQPKTGVPVGIITVAILVMMLLSAVAVIVYMTSQPA